MIGLAPKKRVSDNLAPVFRQSGLVLMPEPALHSLGQFGNGHRVPMSLILDELRVQPDEFVGIVPRCGSKVGRDFVGIFDHVGAS
jgi:hypothetical protein